MPTTARPKKTDIEILKERTYKAYKNIGSLWCPAVKDNIVFNRYGWIHLSFKRNGHRRSPGDLKLRHYLFIEDVRWVVQNSKIAILTFGSVTSKSGITRKTRYYELACLNKGKKKPTSVILRKIGKKGKLHYYSVRRTTGKIKRALKK